MRCASWQPCDRARRATTAVPTPPSLPLSPDSLARSLAHTYAPPSSFGYMTGTNVTLIVACKGAAADHGWVRALFAKLYSDYLEAACNPFAKVGSEITSPAFDARVESACKKHARLPAAP